jgi:hypothetical protein
MRTGTKPSQFGYKASPFQQDDPMTNEARERADSFFARMQRPETEGERAWAEYHARQRAVIENIERLRRVRLAREASTQDRIAQTRYAQKVPRKP